MIHLVQAAAVALALEAANAMIDSYQVSSFVVEIERDLDTKMGEWS